VVHHRDTNVTHADVTRRRGWPFIVVGGLGIGSVARQAAQLSASGWRGRWRPHCQNIASVPPGQILGAVGDCMPAAREHADLTFPWARLKKTPPANACGGQGLRRRLRRAFLGTSRGFLCFLPPKILRLGTISSFKTKIASQTLRDPLKFEI